MRVPVQASSSRDAVASSSVGASSYQAPRAHDDEAINSEDELDRPNMTLSELAELEHQFEEKLAARGLQIRRMADDGNCLFRSVSDRIYGDPEMHDVVRRQCLDHMEKERDHFSQYVTQDFDAYIARKRRDRVFGNHLEIQAISEIYNRPVHVFDMHGDAETPMNAFVAPSEGEAGAPLRLSYHGRSHYNVLIDPSHADVGEGLGLPGMHPGLADQMQVEKAMGESEASALESQLLSAAQDASDMDATQDALLLHALQASAAEAGSLFVGGGGGVSCAASTAPPHAATWRHAVHPSAAPASSGSGGGSASADGNAGADPPGEAVSETVQQLIAMGFSLPRAVQAHAQFGDDLDSMLEYLTSD